MGWEGIAFLSVTAYEDLCQQRRHKGWASLMLVFYRQHSGATSKTTACPVFFSVFKYCTEIILWQIVKDDSSLTNNALWWRHHGSALFLKLNDARSHSQN